MEKLCSAEVGKFYYMVLYKGVFWESGVSISGNPLSLLTRFLSLRARPLPLGLTLGGRNSAVRPSPASWPVTFDSSPPPLPFPTGLRAYCDRKLSESGPIMATAARIPQRWVFTFPAKLAGITMGIGKLKARRTQRHHSRLNPWPNGGGSVRLSIPATVGYFGNFRGLLVCFKISCSYEKCF